MPKYLVEVYKTFVSKHVIEADNPDQAYQTIVSKGRQYHIPHWNKTEFKFEITGQVEPRQIVEISDAEFDKHQGVISHRILLDSLPDH